MGETRFEDGGPEVIGHFDLSARLVVFELNFHGNPRRAGVRPRVKKHANKVTCRRSLPPRAEHGSEEKGTEEKLVAWAIAGTIVVVPWSQLFKPSVNEIAVQKLLVVQLSVIK